MYYKCRFIRHVGRHGHSHMNWPKLLAVNKDTAPLYIGLDVLLTANKDLMT